MPKKHNTTALLIVDLQKGFGTTDKLVKGILKAASGYDVVVATEFVNGHAFSPRASREDLRLGPLPPSAKVFRKNTYGVPPALIGYLKKKGVRHIDICGLEREACVLAAAFNLWDAEIRPRILKDLVGTNKGNENLRKPALLVIRKNFE
ncbi:MAG: hypothetical protein QOE22_65 [Candidatus Parcubacteria bacterium]|jgi:nicotinamidase-related amidase|nr:hypothetical protein [Candidatus Parcubacteria bacterium]